MAATAVIQTQSLSGLIIGILAFFFATIIWALGLFIVGTPVWRVLHWLGLRGPVTASVTGFVLAGGAIALIAWEAWMGIGLNAVLGAVIGHIVWRKAYRPVAVDRETAEVFG